MKNEEIIKMRVIATLLVVLGHSMIIYDPSWNIFLTDNSSEFFYYLKQFINILQMPIFMSISGYLFYFSIKKGKYKDVKAIIKDKFSRLIIPFVFISLFWIVPIRIFVDYKPFVESGYLKSILLVLSGKNSGHIWFLPTLFVIFVIMYKFINCSKNNIKINTIIFILCHLASYKMPNIFFVNLISRYLIFFYGGYIFAEKEIKPSFNNIFIINTLFFIILSGISVFFDLGFYVEISINIFAAFSGMYAIYYLSTKVKMNDKILFLDKNSFVIYLFHSPIIYIMYRYFANINPLLLVSLNILISISCAIILGYMLRKIKLGYLLGEDGVSIK